MYFYLQKGLYIHEIGHAIGLVHEHQRPDRDGYIAIIWDNVYPPYRQWFQTYSTQEVNTDVDYDLGSVMHYGITVSYLQFISDIYDGEGVNDRKKNPLFFWKMTEFTKKTHNFSAVFGKQKQNSAIFGKTVEKIVFSVVHTCTIIHILQ